MLGWQRLQRVLFPGVLFLLPAWWVAAQQPAGGIPPTYVTSGDGTITLYLEAPELAVDCELFRDNGRGGEPNIRVDTIPCNNNITVTGLERDRNYQFQARGKGADGRDGGRSDKVTFISAGVPSFQGQIPILEKYGADSLRLQWPAPNNGGSPVLGYHVDMDANGDMVWQRVYNGTNGPSTLSYLASNLQVSIMYRFRVYAENRVGVSAYTEVSQRISDLMAAYQSRVQTMDTELSADEQYEILLQSVQPTTGVDENVGGRRYVMSIHDVCTLDSTSTLCVRVEPPNPHYAPDLLGSPICCIHEIDRRTGQYLFPYTLMAAGKYSVLIQALEPGGLLGQYWDNQWLYGMPVETRQDPEMSFDWGLGTIALHASDFVSARWTGYIMPDFSETYTFYVDVDDAARLWINGVQIFDRWDQCCQEFSGHAPLQAGELASIRLEYREVAGTAHMRLQWSSFSTPKGPINSGKLFKAPFIQGAPFLVEVVTGEINARMSEAYGEYLTQVHVGESVRFYVQAKDSAGNMMRSNSDTFQADFGGPQAYTSVGLPVTPRPDGLYKMEYLLTAAGSYTLSVTLNGRHIRDSPFTGFTALPGRVSPWNSTATGECVSTFIAGNPCTFVVQAKDAFNNNNDENIGNVTTAIEWEHYLGTTTMPVLNDEALNNAEFGRYFYGTATYIGSGQYQVSYTALREGEHKLYVRINEENILGSPFTLIGQPAVAAYGPKSLTEEDLPPATATAGTEVVFQLQLRDAYGNILASSPAQAPVVSIRDLPPGTHADFGTCTPNGDTGLYDCAVEPTKSGNRVVSVLIDSVEASKLVNVSQLEVVAGPFPIYVAPDVVDTATTEIYGLDEHYVAGDFRPALVQLRDQFGNNLTSSEEQLDFLAYFGPTRLSYVDHDDGTVTAQVGTEVAGRQAVQVSLRGVQIGNTPTPEIPVANTVARFDGTICNVPAQITAGIQEIFQCDPRDTYRNDVNDNDLFIEAEFLSLANVAPMVVVQGIYDVVDFNYNFPLEILKVGSYSVVVQLWARGGLISQYYRTPGFQSLVSLSIDRQHQNEFVIEYTRVDPAIDFFWTGVPVLSCPEDYFSIRWYGYLLPKASGIHNLRVEADSGTRIMIGSSWIIDELRSDIAVRASAQVSLVDHVPIRIEVEYKHLAGTSYLRLYWASTSFEEEKVPTEYLLHPLNVLPGATTTVVVPQEASEMSVASGAVLAEAEAGVVNNFTLHTRDAHDNQRYTETTSQLTGFIDSTPPVSLSFYYAGEGNYTVSAEPIIAGTFDMHVLVGGIDIVGSPFRVTVVPGETSPIHTLITGTGIHTAIAGVEAFFILTLRDRLNNERHSSDEQTVVVDTAIDVGTRVSCVDQGAGVYRCAYRDTIAGTFGVTPYVNGDFVNPVAPHSYPVTIYPKPVDSTSGVTYLFTFTTFFPTVRRDTSNDVVFTVKDDYGNSVPDSTTVHMICEADGPERTTPPYRVPLACVPDLNPGDFRVDLSFDRTGDYNVDCYIANQGGVNAQYYNNRWVEGAPAITRVDTAIDFNWGEGLVTADVSDFASAQFDGYMQLPGPANYTFYVTADDGAKFWLDDELLVSQDEAGQFHTRPILMLATRLYHIQVMYYERTGNARMRLEWSSDQGLERTVIPRERLFHSRALLGTFPQRVVVTDRPGPVEAFYHYDFEYDTNKLAWVPPQDNGAKAILGYHIYRDDGNGGPIDDRVATMDSNTLQFWDTGLIAGQAYYYRIIATNGDDGEPLTISAQPSIPPSRPDPALLIGTGAGSMTFQFTPVTGGAAGWSPIIRYTLYRNDGRGGVLRFSYEGEMDGSSSETLTIGGLVEGRSYLFQTSYWTRVSQSALSDTVSIPCCEFRRPGSAPVNLRREGDQSDEKITVAWDPVTDIGSSSLIYYRLYMDDGSTEISKNTLNADQTDDFFESLIGGRVYRFSVAAVNAAGEGPRSQRLTLIASDIATAPRFVQITMTSKEQIDIAWTKPALPGAAGMSGYKVYVDDGNGGPINNLIWDGGMRASTLTFSWAPRFSDGSVALIAGAVYRFQAQSVNPTGDGLLSEIVSAVAASRPLSPGKPEPERSLTTGLTIHITWDEPDDGGSPILGYVVERVGLDGNWIQLTTEPMAYTGTTYADSSNIAANQVYTYRVSAFNLVTTGTVAYSPESVIAAAAVPDPPEVSFVTSTETTITVSWTTPTSNLIVTGYKLYVDNLLKYDGTGVPTVRTFTLAGCSTGSMHDFRVSALSAAGESLQSPYPLSRLCARRPYPSAQPQLDSSTLDEVTIRWLPPSDTGGMPITGYKVQRSSHDTYNFRVINCIVDGQPVQVLPPEQHACLDLEADLCPQRMCKYRVLAINGIEDDNFADVSPYLSATAAGLPDPPVTVTRDIPPASATAVEVSWSAVTDAAATGGSQVIGYRLYANTGIGDEPVLVFDGSGSPSIRSYRHAGLTPGRRYRYQVASVSGAGEGARTNVFTFLSAAPPSPPPQPRFVDGSGASIVVGLDPPPSDGGSSITRYVPERWEICSASPNHHLAFRGGRFLSEKVAGVSNAGGHERRTPR
jgi:hypothetical protein